MHFVFYFAHFKSFTCRNNTMCLYAGHWAYRLSKLSKRCTCQIRQSPVCLVITLHAYQRTQITCSALQAKKVFQKCRETQIRYLPESIFSHRSIRNESKPIKRDIRTGSTIGGSQYFAIHSCTYTFIIEFD